MIITTVNLSEWQLSCLAKLVEVGRFNNRSDAIRHALNVMIRDELKSLEKETDLDGVINNDLVEIQPRKKKVILDMRTKQTVDEIKRVLEAHGIEGDMDRQV